MKTGEVDFPIAIHFHNRIGIGIAIGIAIGPLELRFFYCNFLSFYPFFEFVPDKFAQWRWVSIAPFSISAYVH
jgi:hypothetical protein